MGIAKSAFRIMKQALRSEGFRRLLDDAGRVLVVREIVEILSGDDDEGKDSPPLPSDPLPPGARDLPGHDGKPIA